MASRCGKWQRFKSSHATSQQCGCSAVGSASPCQGEGHGFEPRHPLRPRPRRTRRRSSVRRSGVFPRNSRNGCRVTVPTSPRSAPASIAQWTRAFPWYGKGPGFDPPWRLNGSHECAVSVNPCATRYSVTPGSDSFRTCSFSSSGQSAALVKPRCPDRDREGARTTRSADTNTI